MLGRTFRCLVIIGLVWAGNAPAAPAKPQVFSGYLSHKALGAKQLMRLHFLSYARPGTGEEATNHYSAVITLHWGSFDNPEYVGLGYDTVRYNPQTKEFLLLPVSATEVSGKLPTIRLRFSSADVAQGDFVSPTTGMVGQFELKRGNDAAPLNSGERLLMPLAGIYRGSCGGKGQGSLEAIELLPSRLPFQGQTPSEAALNVLNYVGTASCNYESATVSRTSCAGFQPGMYNFYRDEVLLYDDVQTVWRCRRDGDKGLTCDNPWYPSCKLTKQAAEENTASKVAVEPPHLEPAPVDAPPPNQVCGAWDGDYAGILRHAETGQEQYLRLKMATILLQGPQPPVRCAMLGSAHLVFGSSIDSDEYTSVTLPQIEFLPNRPDQVIFAEQESDVILQLSQNRAGLVEGNWYSKRRGFVGSFSVVNEFKGELKNPIAALGGKFRKSDSHLTLIPTPATPTAKTANPHQVMVSGWEDYRAMRIQLEHSSYDYFTGFATLQMPGYFLGGKVTPAGLDFHMLTRKPYATSHLGRALNYRREP